MQTAERRAHWAGPSGRCAQGYWQAGSGCEAGQDPQRPWGLQFLSGRGCAEFSKGLFLGPVAQEALPDDLSPLADPPDPS